jgi:hypothetical protein
MDCFEAFNSTELNQTRMPLSELKKKVDKSNSEAFYQYGLRYEKGDEVGKDFNLARKWYGKAEQQNHPKAAYRLALFYRNGWGGAPKNYNEMIKLLIKSGRLGNSKAYYKLGEIYETGIKNIINPDLNEAAKYYERAASKCEKSKEKLTLLNKIMANK